MVYYCALEEDTETGGFVVSFPDVPGALTEGDTKNEALAMASDALNGCLASMVAQGKILPEFKTGPGVSLFPVEVSKAVVVAGELKTNAVNQFNPTLGLRNPCSSARLRT